MTILPFATATDEELKRLVNCEFCQATFDPEADEGQLVGAIDDSLYMCESCYNHYH